MAGEQGAPAGGGQGRAAGSGRDFSALANPGIRGLASYDPGHDIVALRNRAGEQGLLELGGNESAWGPSLLALAALRSELDSLEFYPDPRGGVLKHALAEAFGVDREWLLLGNGTHELLMQIAQVFAGPERPVLVSRYCFAVYPLAAQAANARLDVVEALPRDHPTQPRGHDIEAMIAALRPEHGLVMLANPNNPTGTWLTSAQIERLLAAAGPDTLVVVDEAYGEFLAQPGCESALSLLRKYPNLLVTRTFSKLHGLAALRVGALVADPGIVAVMERVRESFNVNSPGLAAAAAALKDEAHIATVLHETAGNREALALELQARGWFVHPSQTNFLLVDFGTLQTAVAIDRGLLARDIVVRPMRGYGLPACLRITVGKVEQNARLLKALDAVVSEAGLTAHGDGAPLSRPSDGAGR
jgi:histidinol-phosphate aminotransferase